MYHNETQYEGATNVWLTPKWVIDKLGPFDLDPCAADPRPFDIGQRVNLVERDNGLRQHWPPEMFVWMNPPYGPLDGEAGRARQRYCTHLCTDGDTSNPAHCQEVQRCVLSRPTDYFHERRASA